MIIAALSKHDVPRLQYEAAWCLTNVASGTSEQTAILVQNGVVPLLSSLLESSVEIVREQALWGLGNISGDSAATRDVVLSQPDIIAKIHNIVRIAKNRSVIKTTAWALLVMCKGVPPPPFTAVRGMFPVLGTLLHSTDVDVITDSCSAFLCILGSVSGESDRLSRLNALVEMGITRRIAELLSSPSPVVQQLAVRLLGRITAGNDSHTQTVINVGALPPMLSLLSSPSKTVRQEVCWTLSNITAGNESQVDAVISAGFLPYILSFIRGNEYDVKREAAYVVANACCSGSVPQIQKIAAEGGLDALCGLLGTYDARMLAAVLDALDNIARAGYYCVPGADDDDDENIFVTKMEELGVVSQLESLAENHTDVAVSEAANRLLQRFNDEATFSDDDDGDADDGDAANGRMQSLMDAAFAAEQEEDVDEEEESDDVIVVPDMPSAQPVSLPSSSIWSTTSTPAAAPSSGFSFASLQPSQPSQQQQFFFR